MKDFRDKTILILGLGASGYSAAEFLLKRKYSVKISEAGDSSAIRTKIDKLGKIWPLVSEVGAHTREFCSEADMIVASPGINIKDLYAERSIPEEIPLMGTLELGASFCEAPMIAVTGTNGKSTVTKLLGHIFSFSGKNAVVCGNIGNPLIGEVDGLKENSVVIVEVSSFQLETIVNFKPHIAILLNISEDHYDRHRDHKSYKAEKYKIFRNQTEEDWAVINSDLKNDDEIGDIKSRIVFFETDPGLLKELSIREEDLPLSGKHNLENVVCSIMAAGIMKVEKDLIKKAILTFKPLRHRIEKVGIFRGVEFIDDSKATNIDATRRAVEMTKKGLILISGGVDKGGDYTVLIPLFKNKVKTLIVMGEAKEKIKSVFSSVIHVIETENMGSAVAAAKENAREGDTVMLSPMCSSFDMFSGYKERGEAFQREVKR
ncbi:MAG: UDP-N-acetylmuramoyl-L-alanine--D-glutamate ligase [Candidatus Omnitrophota bacterium]